MTGDRSTSRDVSEIELDQFDVSTRTRNCLTNQRVVTIGQLCDLTTSDIRRWDNAGRKTLRELQELLGSVGLKLKDDPEPIGTLKWNLFEEVAAHTSDPHKGGRRTKPSTIFLRQAPPEVQRRLLARLSSFSLSTRARRVVVQERLMYLGEIVRLKQREFSAFKGSGRHTASELVSLVQGQGFEPGTSIPDWSREAAGKLEVEFRDELQMETVKRSSDFLATLGPEPTCIEDELARIAAALAS
jgi:DNA-directed RNA polymerase alpha subunit